MDRNEVPPACLMTAGKKVLINLCVSQKALKILLAVRLPVSEIALCSMVFIN